MSSLLSEKNFRLKNTSEGIFVLFGNENQTIDNGLIKISDKEENIEFKDNMYFSVEYFINMFKAMAVNVNIKLKYLLIKLFFVEKMIFHQKSELLLVLQIKKVVFLPPFLFCTFIFLFI